MEFPHPVVSLLLNLYLSTITEVSDFGAVMGNGVTWHKLTPTIKRFKKFFIITNFFILVKFQTF